MASSTQGDGKLYPRCSQGLGKVLARCSHTLPILFPYLKYGYTMASVWLQYGIPLGKAREGCGCCLGRVWEWLGSRYSKLGVRCRQTGSLVQANLEFGTAELGGVFYAVLAICFRLHFAYATPTLRLSYKNRFYSQFFAPSLTTYNSPK